ncbi:hypothetical protein C8J57DRAFT_1459015 [Mycena rebaudengoi]|nr:hypothetical protein C8J57DRAFT_1459015 [Mycena rebaudengoi]
MLILSHRSWLHASCTLPSLIILIQCLLKPDPNCRSLRITHDGAVDARARTWDRRARYSSRSIQRGRSWIAAGSSPGGASAPARTSERPGAGDAVAACAITHILAAFCNACRTRGLDPLCVSTRSHYGASTLIGWWSDDPSRRRRESSKHQHRPHRGAGAVASSRYVLVLHRARELRGVAAPFRVLQRVRRTSRDARRCPTPFPDRRETSARRATLRPFRCASSECCAPVPPSSTSKAIASGCTTRLTSSPAPRPRRTTTMAPLVQIVQQPRMTIPAPDRLIFRSTGLTSIFSRATLQGTIPTAYISDSTYRPHQSVYITVYIVEPASTRHLSPEIAASNVLPEIDLQAPFLFPFSNLTTLLVISTTSPSDGADEREQLKLDRYRMALHGRRSARWVRYMAATILGRRSWRGELLCGDRRWSMYSPHSAVRASSLRYWKTPAPPTPALTSSRKVSPHPHSPSSLVPIAQYGGAARMTRPASSITYLLRGRYAVVQAASSGSIGGRGRGRSRWCGGVKEDGGRGRNGTVWKGRERKDGGGMGMSEGGDGEGEGRGGEGRARMSTASKRTVPTGGTQPPSGSKAEDYTFQDPAVREDAYAPGAESRMQAIVALRRPVSCAASRHTGPLSSTRDESGAAAPLASTRGTLPLLGRGAVCREASNGTARAEGFTCATAAARNMCARWMTGRAEVVRRMFLRAGLGGAHDERRVAARPIHTHPVLFSASLVNCLCFPYGAGTHSSMSSLLCETSTSLSRRAARRVFGCHASGCVASFARAGVAAFVSRCEPRSALGVDLYGPHHRRLATPSE